MLRGHRIVSRGHSRIGLRGIMERHVRGGDGGKVRIHIRVVLGQLVELLGNHGHQVEGRTRGDRLVLHYNR